MRAGQGSLGQGLKEGVAAQAQAGQEELGAGDGPSGLVRAPYTVSIQ